MRLNLKCIIRKHAVPNDLLPLELLKPGEWADVEDKYRALVPLAGLSSHRVEESLALIRAFDAPDSVSRLVKLIGAV